MEVRVFYLYYSLLDFLKSWKIEYNIVLGGSFWTGKLFGNTSHIFWNALGAVVSFMAVEFTKRKVVPFLIYLKQKISKKYENCRWYFKSRRG